MEAAVLAPPAPQQEEVPQEEEGAQEGAKEVEVVQPDEQVMAEQDPKDPAVPPAPSTSKAPTASASTGAAKVLVYMNKCQGFAKTWFEEVVEKKEQAYRDLIASLVGLIEEQSKVKDLKLGFVGFSNQEVDNVLGSISDMSGKYIDSVDHHQVEVSKEEEEITRKIFTGGKKASEVQDALDDYYDAAKDLCHYQAVYMARLKKTEQGAR